MKRVKDNGEEAFPNHELVSAQLAVHFLHVLGYDISFILQVAEWIQWHMLILRNGQEPKTIARLKKKMGIQMWRQLVFFHQANQWARK